MHKVKVQVIGLAVTGFSRPQWWINFCNYINDKDIDFIIEMSNHNAVNLQGTEFIEFETEEDFIVFKLRWS